MGMLTAIILIMSFTPLGYLKMPLGLEITLLTIPVSVGAMVLGAKEGAVLGGIFGVTSFIQCFGASQFGTILLGINPYFTFIVCIVPRVLIGWITGIVFEKVKSIDKTKLLSFGAGGFSTAILNTILFVGSLVIFFYPKMSADAASVGKNMMSYLIFFIGINGLVEAIVCPILSAAVGKAVYVACEKYGIIEK